MPRSRRCGRANAQMRRSVFALNGRESDWACEALYSWFHAVTSMLMPATLGRRTDNSRSRSPAAIKDGVPDTR